MEHVAEEWTFYTKTDHKTWKEGWILKRKSEYKII